MTVYSAFRNLRKFRKLRNRSAASWNSNTLKSVGIPAGKPVSILVASSGIVLGRAGADHFGGVRFISDVSGGEIDFLIKK